MKKNNILGIFLSVLFLALILIGFLINFNNDVVRDLSGEESPVLEKSRLKELISEEREIVAEPIQELTTNTLIEPIETAKKEVVNGNLIRVNYIGWRASDGVVFDKSFDRGDEGFTFRVGAGVIEGWSQGVLGMKVGEVRRLKIPSSLAYGENGAGELIPPNTGLIFDVELLEILE